MTQNSLVVTGPSGLQVRQNINKAFETLVTQNKGSSAPTEKYPGMPWLDDSASAWSLKMYDGTDWILIGTINPSTNKFMAANASASASDGASLSLIFTNSFSNVPYIEIKDIPQTYDQYEIDITGFVPATNGVNLVAQFSADNGGTYIGGTSYRWTYNNKRDDNTPGDVSDTASASAVLIYGASNSSSYGTSGDGRFYGLPGSLYKNYRFSSTRWDGVGGSGGHAHGYCLTSNPINAIKLFCSSGNIAQVKASLRGLRIA